MFKIIWFAIHSVTVNKSIWHHMLVSSAYIWTLLVFNNEYNITNWLLICSNTISKGRLNQGVHSFSDKLSQNNNKGFLFMHLTVVNKYFILKHDVLIRIFTWHIIFHDILYVGGFLTFSIHFPIYYLALSCLKDELMGLKQQSGNKSLR